MPDKERKNLFLYFWGMAGILLALMISLMEAGEGWNIDNFLDQEQTYEFSEADLVHTEDTCRKNVETGLYQVVADKAVLQIEDLYQSGNWKYMAINISDMNYDAAKWDIVYSNKKGEVVSKQTATLVDGDNMIEIACRQSYQSIKLVIKEQAGLSFRINSIQCRTNDVIISPQTIMTKFFFWMGLYLGISGIIYLARKSKMYTIIELLQEGYALFGDYMGRKLIAERSRKHIGMIRTGMITLLFVMGELSGILGWYEDANGYKYYMLLIAVLITLLGVLCWESDLTLLNWNSMIPVAWMLLWVSVCISDVMESKNYKFVGYVFLLAVGFFFFSWNNMAEPQKIKREIYMGFNLNFVLVAVYCMIFRAKKIGVLYNGAFLSREDSAIYAVTAVGVFLAQLYKELFRENEKYRWNGRIVLYIIGIAVSVSFLYYSNTISCNLAFVTEVIIFGYYIFRRKKILTTKAKELILAVIPAVLLAILCVKGVNMAINYLPEKLGTELRYANEVLETKQDISVLESLRVQEPDYYYNVSLAGENTKGSVCLEYLQKINLFGHAEELEVAGATVKVSNTWIEVIYRYGLFILIPYVLLFAACFARAYKEKKAMLFIMTTLLFIMPFQNIELPFVHPVWILYYLGMGEWFQGS